MLVTIKDFIDEISLLPKAVKIAILTIVLFAASFSLFFGVKNVIGNYKIERLERENRELNRSAQTAQEKAAKAERNAADESVRAQSLESQLKTLEAKTIQSD